MRCRATPSPRQLLFAPSKQTREPRVFPRNQLWILHHRDQEITNGEQKYLCVLRGLRGKSLMLKMDTPEPFDEEVNEPFNGAELSESVLGRDWNSPEEDAAWSNL